MKPNPNDFLFSPWTMGVVAAAVRLNIFSAVSKERFTDKEIAEKISAKPNFLKPLLDACVSIGLLSYTDNKYSNTYFSRIYLIENEYFYIGDFIKLVNYESLQWYQLPNIIRGKKKE